MPGTLEHSPDRAYILAKGLFRAAEQLGLTPAELGKMLGASEGDIALLKETMAIQPNSREGELARLLIRVAQSLTELSGDDNEWITRYMRSTNKMTGGMPVDQLQSKQGLTQVLSCLEAFKNHA
ncbi:MAG: MbcA/ParS/Xre antitoxin family protein [Motiliproteus sp.]|nr:MbcA/ParS/Xre antitoxin family protein [Motiliproteus sp.]MCW9053527.1 MbcA/ParS/Xre antitoxin family protein [Motiliproteus sp.]